MAALLSLQCLFGLAEYRNDTRYACFCTTAIEERSKQSMRSIDHEEYNTEKRTAAVIIISKESRPSSYFCMTTMQCNAINRY